MCKIEDRVIVPDTDDGNDMCEDSLFRVKCGRLYMLFYTWGKKIIETSKKFSYNISVVQLLGYYYHVATDLHKPGICVLVTRKSLCIILFPFNAPGSEGRIVNAVSLNKISMETLMLLWSLL